MKNLFIASVIVTGLTLLQTSVFAQTDAKEGKINEIGLSFSTNLNTGLTYKYGGQKIYGLIQVGTNYSDFESPILGVGIGTNFNINDQSDFKLEGVFLSYFYDDFNESKIDKGFHFNFLYEREINSRFKFNVGPSIGITENNSSTGFDNKTMIDPISTFNMGNTETGLIIGLGAGIMYNF